MPFRYHLTEDECLALVLLDQGAREPADIARDLAPGHHAPLGSRGPATAALLGLARLGLAETTGTVWKVTGPGRELARWLHDHGGRPCSG